MTRFERRDRRAPQQPAAIAIGIHVGGRRRALPPVACSPWAPSVGTPLQQRKDRPHELECCADIPAGDQAVGPREPAARGPASARRGTGALPPCRWSCLPHQPPRLPAPARGCRKGRPTRSRRRNAAPCEDLPSARVGAASSRRSAPTDTARSRSAPCSRCRCARRFAAFRSAAAAAARRGHRRARCSSSQRKKNASKCSGAGISQIDIRVTMPKFDCVKRPSSVGPSPQR